MLITPLESIAIDYVKLREAADKAMAEYQAYFQQPDSTGKGMELAKVMNDTENAARMMYAAMKSHVKAVYL
jgi:uncharacterized membrane protein